MKKKTGPPKQLNLFDSFTTGSQSSSSSTSSSLPLPSGVNVGVGEVVGVKKRKKKYLFDDTDDDDDDDDDDDFVVKGNESKKDNKTIKDDDSDSDVEFIGVAPPSSSSSSSSSSTTTPKSQNQKQSNLMASMTFTSTSRFTSKSSSSTSQPTKKKPAKPKPKPKPTSSTAPTDSNDLWINRHPPLASKDLVLHAAKTKEIKAWMESSLYDAAGNAGYVVYVNSSKFSSSSSSSSSSKAKGTGTVKGDAGSGGGVPHFLILAGPPGIGKSTAVDVIYHELLDERSSSSQSGSNGSISSILKWNDNYQNLKSDRSWSCNEYEGGEGGEGGSKSQLQDFCSFLKGACSSVQMLDVTHTSTSTKSSKKKEMKEKQGPKLVIIDDLPNLHTQNQILEFQDCLTSCTSSYNSKAPTTIIMIYSITEEKSVNYKELEKLIGSHVYSSTNTTIINVNPASRTSLLKVFKNIVTQEGLTNTVKFMNDEKEGEDLLDAVVDECLGDLRWGVGSLMVRFLGVSVPQGGGRSGKSGGGKMVVKKKGEVKGKSKTKDKIKTKEEGSFTRDVKLSPFHALGKLLYAKRLELESGGSAAPATGQRRPLSFDPEKVLESSSLTLDSTLSFITHHSPSFFGDIHDLSNAFDNFSTSALFLEHQYSNSSGGGGGGSSSGSGMNSMDNTYSSYPFAQAASLISRSCAYYNLQSVKQGFKTLNKPTLFAVLKSKNMNFKLLDQLRENLLTRTNDVTLNEEASGSGNIVSRQEFVTGTLDFGRRIDPQGYRVETYSYLRGIKFDELNGTDNSDSNKQGNGDDFWRRLREVGSGGGGGRGEGGGNEGGDIEGDEIDDDYE